VTNWYFDITVLPFLENFWYGIEKEKLDQNFWMENIEIIDNNIILRNQVKIDLWSIWKWYLVDYIYHILKNRMDNFTIDFWWDIRVWNQKEIIWLEDPFNDKKIIWEIIISNESICSSNWQKRNFWDNHHLINPITKTSQNDKVAVYVKHKSATLADWYSTALFVSPLNLALEIIEKTKWLEAMIISDKWEIYKSVWFDVKLY
jgi:thiamine biosynthesis lipoprotein